MATTWYKSTKTSKIVKDSRGFKFSKMASFYQSNINKQHYGMYSVDAGGWENDSQTNGKDTPNYWNVGYIYSKRTDMNNYGTVIGEIVPITAYTVTTTIPTGGGTATGDGDYESGTKATITAKPNSGYVTKSINDTVFEPTIESVSLDIVMNTDITVSVEFEKYYNLVFDANTTDNVSNLPTKITPCLANKIYVVPTIKPTRSGYKFEGWATSVDGDVVYAPGESYVRSQVSSAGENINLYAVWSQAKISYDANGGDSVPAEQFYYGEITLANAIIREGREFVGWKIGDEIYPAGAKYNLTSTVVAVAQWSNISFKNSNSIAGKLSLYDISANKKVAEENLDGYLIYSGRENSRYRVDCELLGIFHDKKGVYVDGEYIEPYVFTFSGDDVVGEYFYREKSLYAITFECSPKGNTASVTSPSSPDKDGKYVEGQAITVTGSPAPGYKLKAANVFNSDTNFPIGDFDNIENNKFTIDAITSNLRIICTFVKVDYSIAVSEDEKSKDVISDVTAMMGNTHVVTATYGDEVTFEADVDDGYSFGGWYADGALVSTDNPYKHTVVGSINLAAKAKVAVTLGIEHIDNREEKPTSIANSCTLAVNGATVEKVPYTFDVVLGESFSYVLTLGSLIAGGETWKFDAWYSGNTKLQYRKDDTVTPTVALSMTAKVTSAPIQRTLSVRFVNEETKDEIAVSEDVVKISPESSSISVGASTVSFVIDGTQEVQLKFIDEIQSDESLAFSKVVIGETEISDPIFNYLVNDNIYATAYYGSTGERITSIDFADESDRTMGEIVLEGMTSNEEPTPIAITKNRGESVGIMAMSKNGYRFVGWYLNAIGIGDPYIKDGSIQLKVTTNRTLFAKFVQDPNAVYEWEGSSENKMMVWRSKTYEASKPFNPSACRVDTTGYPVALLSVEMFSAPDREPTAVAKLTNVQSQNARRLPICRMERYVQVAVSNDEEVDIILVGTSMGGLAI